MKKDLLSKIASYAAICIAIVSLVIGFVTVTKLSKLTKEFDTEEKYSLSFDKDTLKITTNGSAAVDYANSKIQGNSVVGIIALNQKGDNVIFTWNIVNDGETEAVLSSTPELLGLQDVTQQAIDYEITIDNKPAKKGMTIEAGETKTAKMVVTYSTKKTKILPTNTIEVVTTSFNYKEK